MTKAKKRISSAQIIAIGFAGLILIGTLILMLPISTADRHGASFFDAIFTATSAVCVTGLIVQDTATYWSVFGKAVIICLIQIGGMGVVTFAVAIARASGKKIGLRQRSIMQDAVSAPYVGGIVKLTGFIIKGTVLFELLGAVITAPAFIREFGVFKGILYSLFHSVSAFCNAGFDLMGVREKYSSLTLLSSDPFINIGIMFVIIVGGLGFLTWGDIKEHRHHIRKYSLQSKLSLSMAAVLVIVPAVYFFFGEFSDLPLGERFWVSLFQSVTARTAGFNTIGFDKMTESGIMVMIMLMLTGGSPGSTAGGMKTTTIAVLFAAAVSVFRRKDTPHYFGRRIDDKTVRKAVSLLVMYLTLFIFGGIAISRIESLPLLTCLFESASAVATVGLTMGITPTLHAASKIILIALMYFGRVGGLTLIFATINTKQSAVSRLPQESLTVG